MKGIEIEKLERITDWEIHVQFTGPVTIEEYINPGTDRSPIYDPCTSADWMITTKTHGGRKSGVKYSTTLYNGGPEATVSDYDPYAYTWSPEGDYEEQQRKVFCMLLAQITEAFHDYSLNPHTGELKKHPEHL